MTRQAIGIRLSVLGTILGSIALFAVVGAAEEEGGAGYTPVPPPSGRKIEYSPYPRQDFPNQVSSATRTCTRATPPTPAWSGARSAPKTPTASPWAKRSSRARARPLA